jgi:general secretion pathway protein I
MVNSILAKVMISILKFISGLTLRRHSIGDAGERETTDQFPVSSFQFPVNGFTLLEVMVSVAIMSIVLVSVYRLHSQSLTMDTESRFYTQAPMLAQGKLAEMGAGEDAEFTNDSGQFGENFEGYSWNVSVDDVDIEALGEISQDLKKIEVTVSYNDNEFVYNLRTYRIIRGE